MDCESGVYGAQDNVSINNLSTLTCSSVTRSYQSQSNIFVLLSHQHLTHAVGRVATKVEGSLIWERCENAPLVMI